MSKKEEYKGKIIESHPNKLQKGGYSLNCSILINLGQTIRDQTYFSDKTFETEEEADLFSISAAKKIIDNDMISK